MRTCWTSFSRISSTVDVSLVCFVLVWATVRIYLYHGATFADGLIGSLVDRTSIHWCFWRSIFSTTSTSCKVSHSTMQWTPSICVLDLGIFRSGSKAVQCDFVLRVVKEIITQYDRLARGTWVQICGISIVTSVEIVERDDCMCLIRINWVDRRE